MALLLGKALSLKCHHIGRGPSLPDSLSLPLSSHSLYMHNIHRLVLLFRTPCGIYSCIMYACVVSGWVIYPYSRILEVSKIFKYSLTLIYGTQCMHCVYVRVVSIKPSQDNTCNGIWSFHICPEHTAYFYMAQCICIDWSA